VDGSSWPFSSVRCGAVINRNPLYPIIGALAIATVVLSHLYYQERQKTTCIEITVDESGISIEQK
jgi:hypothetical protein